LPEKVLFIFLTLLAFFIFFLNRKKISYWIAPDTVISYYLKKTLVAMNVFFALILGAVLHTFLETYINFEAFLDRNSVFRILVIVSEVIIWIILIGFSIERYLMLSNQDFREWKNKKRIP
jgi:hypothetical protein